MPVRLPALLEQLLDHHLRRDACVVRARDPKHVVASHAVPPAEQVLHGHGERVAQVERAGDVGRRQADGKLWPVVLWVARRQVVPGCLPPIIPRRLDGMRLVAWLHRLGHALALAFGRRVDVGTRRSGRIEIWLLLLLFRCHDCASRECNVARTWHQSLTSTTFTFTFMTSTTPQRQFLSAEFAEGSK